MDGMDGSEGILTTIAANALTTVGPPDTILTRLAPAQDLVGEKNGVCMKSLQSPPTFPFGIL
jgi:hypothetical protein